MNSVLFKKCGLFFLLGFLSFSALSEARILRPDPSMFHQISGFEPDWCGEKLCYGTARFRASVSVRAILVKGKAPALFLEDEWQSIELLKPVFGLIGPVNPHPTLRVGTGRASVTIDPKGNVDSVRIFTPALGTIQDFRGR